LYNNASPANSVEVFSAAEEERTIQFSFLSIEMSSVSSFSQILQFFIPAGSSSVSHYLTANVSQTHPNGMGRKKHFEVKQQEANHDQVDTHGLGWR